MEMKHHIPGLRVAIIGDGAGRNELFDALNKGGVDFDYFGFVTQRDLPDVYCNAKVLLFPTLRDPWGIVVNEALASGTPVLTSPFAGVAHDLIVDGQNGFVVSLDVDKWVTTCIRILTREKLWKELSANARKSVDDYTFSNAANGII